MGVAENGKKEEGELPTIEEHLAHCGVGRWQMMIFAIVSLLVLSDGMEMTVISLLRQPLQQEWGLDDFTFSALGSTVFAGLLVGNLIGGYLADTFGRRNCLLGVSAVFCVFGLLSAVAPDVWVFAFARFFTGIGVGSMVPVSDSHLLEWSPSAWRARLAMALTGVAFAIGAAFACVVGVEISQYGGEEWWRWMLLICILPGLISLPLCWFFLPESPHYLLVHGRVEECEDLLRQLADANGVEPLANGKVAHMHSPIDSSAWDPWAIFGKELWATSIYATVAWVVCGFVYYGHIFIYPVLLEELYEMKVKEAYSTVLISVLVEITAVILAMILMDIEGIGRRGAMGIGFGLTALCAFLIPWSQDLNQFIILNSAIKGVIEGPFTVIYIYAGELFPTTHRGTAVAFCNSFGRVAAMMAPVVVMASFHADPLQVFSIFTVLSVLGLVTTLIFQRETLGQPLYMYTDEIELHAGVPLLGDKDKAG
mmetsp:Transcript_7181/g.14427  ORF Transcript_7181/g.14427 Transcript_7181/m.14427 type:complete len:481 (+) Transcript_7181:20-1462(+)|eukprot:CAMPEP_0196742164 /NCGR_PEP_ID=MMETSP1091-20130531/44989_1 /TAXON_ID=302021 /ORGANISM="Rhodomonas sp., Strain CCMP768" /LENGTH=480 /DNA_ID=CAMNT_0042088129 /DNA_START=20 /DNA_END=1462 /DNA_ORIENTATION=-